MGVVDEFAKIAILENEVEAQIVDSILTERRIPHFLRSYYDAAYDGIYQMQKGWGALYAPEEWRSDIVEILDDFRANPGDSPDDGPSCEPLA